MMSSALAIQVRFHDGRYHGDGDWPPCPARLFQALVAGAGLSGQIDNEATEALKWLETLPPPLVGAPPAWRGQRVMFYMPNNDMDSIGGDPRRGAEIRTAKKFFSPRLFDADIPFLYIWQDLSDEDIGHTRAIRLLADRLYQLGRGIDMAWAWAQVLDISEVDALLTDYPGRVQRPSPGVGSNNDNTLLCPHPGSLESVCARHKAYRHRFEVERKGKTTKSTFHKAPRPSFRPVAYDGSPARYVYELRTPSAQTLFVSWPLSEVSKLIVCLRDAAVAKLTAALPDQVAEIDRVLVGRKPDGVNAGPTAERVRIIPLPSIGHPHADLAIRRVLVEISAACPLRADDIAWAFSALEPVDSATGEVYPVVLTPTDDDSMLWNYGAGKDTEACKWHTVTPVAAPQAASRRRIEPARMLAEIKAGTERVQEQRRAAAAIVQALRHADIREQVETIRVQREPFEGNGERIEAFAPGTRFPHRRLWHVEITFSKPVSGPLVIGDGRFLGLGVMAPIYTNVQVVRYALDSNVLPLVTETLPVAEAARRCLMGTYGRSVWRRLHGDGPYPKEPALRPKSPVFSGKDAQGICLKGHRHAYYLPTDEDGDGRLDHLTVFAATGFQRDERLALDLLRELRVDQGDEARHPLRLLLLGMGTLDEYKPGPLRVSRVWVSTTPYLATRFAKTRGRDRVDLGSPEAKTAFLVEDLRRQLKAALSDLDIKQVQIEPVVDTNDAFKVGGHLRPIQFKRYRHKSSDDGGRRLAGAFRLTFATAVSGPIALGHSAHFGMGLFMPLSEDSLTDRS